MNKFWADMIIAGKAKFSDISSNARREGVKKVLGQYVADGKITQEDFDRYISE